MGFKFNDGDPYGNACVFGEGTSGSYNVGGKKSSKKKLKHYIYVTPFIKKNNHPKNIGNHFSTLIFKSQVIVILSSLWCHKGFDSLTICPFLLSRNFGVVDYF